MAQATSVERAGGWVRETIDIGDPAGGHLAALAFGPRERPLDALVLHANGFNALTYRTLLEPLAADLRLLAYDHRGHGRTTLPADPEGRRDWTDIAADLVAVLDRTGGPPVTLVGHSMGGTSALLAADLRPARVRNLVLLDPVILPPEPRPGGHSALAEGALRRRATFASRGAALASYRGRGAFRTWPDAVLADYVADGFRDGPEGVTLACTGAWEASNYRAQGHDARGALRRLSRPALILRAGQGSTCHLTEGPSAAVTVETVPGTTHFLPFEAPERVRAAIREAAGGPRS
ncbi:2-succinyl-6-hydroxy-2, 4-cyclohexadiene-1-carboxylate synthase [Methylobacterium crusticola]|uniref:2-succinyl-6-hydroxy-2, 4-cyclohexadiene-1-carboxylate synthase n=1 Tax=Methylobacterium crusticola TaxID=1697972 RepID=A0ABQ4R5B3_9HYPH|nr:alpha/beta hydrolase [Methylobacterium crusticola]GJD52637.1 2-succinyl-6-hydroxy-2, 4-cyclohexadiene-1-carboxylate synthase [Methylobacterium crusticola]